MSTPTDQPMSAEFNE
jgi:hypothetical protein